MATQTLERLLERIDRLDRATLISLVKKFYKQMEIFEKIINLIEDGIVVIRGNGHVILANGSAEKILNVSHLRDMIFWRCVPEFIR
ncbi:MAG: hypothetical protein LBG09_00140 [Puniceicoccales bacterium]|nr:hypothetical protein [Puniceicoccales bacterium]